MKHSLSLSVANHNGPHRRITEANHKCARARRLCLQRTLRFLSTDKARHGHRRSARPHILGERSDECDNARKPLIQCIEALNLNQRLRHALTAKLAKRVIELTRI